MIESISQMNALNSYQNVAFKANLKATQKVVTATIAPLALAAGALVKDTFVKEMSEEDINFEHNLKLLPQDKKFLQAVEKKFNIKGKTYTEKMNIAQSKRKSLECLIREGERLYNEYRDEETRSDLFNDNRDKEMIEGYISVLKSVSGCQYTKEEADERTSLIKEYIKLNKAFCRMDEDSVGYDEMEEKVDNLGTTICNYLIDPDIYTYC